MFITWTFVHSETLQFQCIPSNIRVVIFLYYLLNPLEWFDEFLASGVAMAHLKSQLQIRQFEGIFQQWNLQRILQRILFDKVTILSCDCSQHKLIHFRYMYSAICIRRFLTVIAKRCKIRGLSIKKILFVTCQFDIFQNVLSKLCAYFIW